jgi:hypothetical protein
MCSSLMTQTGEENRRGMIRIRPYGAGFGQFDSAYKVGEGILFKAEIAFNFTHFIVQKPHRLEIQPAERKKPNKMLSKAMQHKSPTICGKDNHYIAEAGKQNQIIGSQTNFMLLITCLHLTFVYKKILTR